MEDFCQRTTRNHPTHPAFTFSSQSFSQLILIPNHPELE